MFLFPKLTVLDSPHVDNRGLELSFPLDQILLLAQPSRKSFILRRNVNYHEEENISI